MTTEHRSPEEIETDIERERLGLTNTLDDLQERLSLDGMVSQLTQQVRIHGGDIGASVARAMKENPLPLALTGAGLVWLMASSRNTSPDPQKRPYGYVPDNQRGNDRSDYGGPVEYEPRRSSTPSWVKRSDGYRTSQRHGQHDEGLGDRLHEGIDAVSDRANELGDRAMDSIEDIRDYLIEGTESFTDEARARIRHARLRAVEARRKAMRHARDRRDRASDMLSEHPIMTGAFGLALGAALGAMLPRTRTEDRTLGEYSDALIHKAERIYAEEKSKLSDVADAAMDEAKSVAGDISDKAKDSADSASHEAKEGANRVADAVKAEADRHNLAKSNL
jgi:ElaB/YqjD/DUF883 family membrane-anchored ribosome-binding protein